jgi:hypothetical protein
MIRHQDQESSQKKPKDKTKNPMRFDMDKTPEIVLGSSNDQPKPVQQFSATNHTVLDLVQYKNQKSNHKQLSTTSKFIAPSSSLQKRQRILTQRDKIQDNTFMEKTDTQKVTKLKLHKSNISEISNHTALTRGSFDRTLQETQQIFGKKSGGLSQKMQSLRVNNGSSKGGALAQRQKQLSSMSEPQALRGIKMSSSK